MTNKGRVEKQGRFLFSLCFVFSHNMMHNRSDRIDLRHGTAMCILGRERDYVTAEYEAMKQGVIQAARGMREMNKVLPVSGERIDLPLKGRDVNIIYYRAEKPGAPLIIGYHGGGYLFGGSAMNDRMWSAMAKALGVNIASVEYRKSPDFGWREGLEDGLDAAVYLYEHAAEFGFDPDRIGVTGMSAGAGMAARVCLYAKQKGHDFIRRQVLIYPFVDAATDPAAKGEGSLGGPIMYIFNELYCDPSEAKNPLASPIFATKEELAGLPEAIVCLAENDNLRHEGMQYAEKLVWAGVQVHLRLEQGMPHGYFEYGFGENFKGESDYLDDATKAMIADGRIPAGSQKTLEFIKQCLPEA